MEGYQRIPPDGPDEVERLVPASRTVRGIPTEVALDPDASMPAECVLRLANLTSMPKLFLRDRITRLSRRQMDEVCRALRVATAC